MINITIENIYPGKDFDQLTIEAKVIWVSDVKTTRPDNKYFRYFQRILLADETANILGLIKTDDETEIGISMEKKVGKFFRIPLAFCGIQQYNSQFSVGEHQNGAEMWLTPSGILDWEELETVTNAAAISHSIPFHFLNFDQLQKLPAFSPFDILGTVVTSYSLEEDRPPRTEIMLKIQGGEIVLAGWGKYADILEQKGPNGEPLKIAIKGVRKLSERVDANTHVGNTADLFPISGDEDFTIFDANTMEIYRETFQEITRENVRTHEQNVHKVAMPSETCSYCKKVYPKRALRKHIRVVHKKLYVLKQKCYFCFRRFMLPSDLAVHMLKHTGEKHFKCTQCAYEARVLHQLKKHVKVNHSK